VGSLDHAQPQGDLSFVIHVGWLDLHPLCDTAQLAMQALALLGRDAAVHEFVVSLGLVDETL